MGSSDWPFTRQVPDGIGDRSAFRSRAVAVRRGGTPASGTVVPITSNASLLWRCNRVMPTSLRKLLTRTFICNVNVRTDGYAVRPEEMSRAHPQERARHFVVSSPRAGLAHLHLSLALTMLAEHEP